MVRRQVAVRSSDTRDVGRGPRTSGFRSTLSCTRDEPLGSDDGTFVCAAADLACVVCSRDLEEEELSVPPNELRCGGNGSTEGSGGRVNDLERDADGEFARSKIGAENTRSRELHQSHHAGSREHRRESVRRFEVESTGEIGLRHGETCGSSGTNFASHKSIQW